MIEEYMFKKLSIIVVLAALALLSIFILWPIASAIITGLILSYIFYPVYKKVLNTVNNKSLSAIIVLLLVIFLIFIPLWFISPFVVKQAFEIYSYLQKTDIFDYLSSIFPSLAKTGFSTDFVISFNTFISGLASKVFAGISSLILNLPSFLLKLVVVFFVFFFGMRDAELFTNYLKSLSPFSKDTEKDLEKKFKSITNAVIYGFIVVGILQGILTGLGLFIFQMPNALLLTILATLGAIIPVVGAWIVWLPSSIYLLVSGHIFLGISLFIYGAFFVSWIDNIIRPYIIAKKTKLSTAIVLIGMIGGLIVFGILGLIIGPLILSYLLLILDAYRNRKFPGLFSEKG